MVQRSWPMLVYAYAVGHTGRSPNTSLSFFPTWVIVVFRLISLRLHDLLDLATLLPIRCGAWIGVDGTYGTAGLAAIVYQYGYSPLAEY